jgi:MFS family permease
MPALPVRTALPAEQTAGRRSTRFWPRLWNRVDQFVAGPIDEEASAPPLARRGRRYLWLDGLFANISESFVGSFLTPFLLTLGATNSQIGILNATTNAGAALSLLPGARLSERSRQRKPFVLWTAGGVSRALLPVMAIMPLVLGPSAAIWAVMALVALRAFFNQVCFPAWSSLAADIVPVNIRGRYFASRNIAVGVGALVFAPVAGAIIQLIGAPVGYQVSFLIAGLVGFVATAAYARIPEPRRPLPAQPHQASRPGIALSALRGHPRFVAFTAVALLWNLTIQIAAPFFSVYMVRNLSATPGQIGLLAAVFSIWNIVGQRAWGRLNDRRGAAWVMRVTGLFIPAVPLIWALAPNIWWLFPEESLSGFLWAGYGLASFTLMLSLSPEAQRPRFVAIYQTAAFSAAFVGPLIGSYLANTTGIHSLFLMSSAGRLAVAILFWFTVRGDSEVQ